VPKVSCQILYLNLIDERHPAEGLLKYPVVIIHGFADRPTLSGIANVAETVLSELGIEHFTPQIEAFGSIFERSKSLVKQIANKYPGRTVHLIAHSMVGLTFNA